MASIDVCPYLASELGRTMWNSCPRNLVAKDAENLASGLGCVTWSSCPRGLATNDAEFLVVGLGCKHNIKR